MEIVFWLGVAVVLYTYVGYGLLMWLGVKLKKATRGLRQVPLVPTEALPTVSLVIAAYNERDFMPTKAENTLALDYPPEKLQIIFVTDGSNDGTPEALQPYPRITVLHQPQRAGKIAAMHRAMHFATGQISVFTDANTLLNDQALRQIVKHYQDPRTGGVAGEKRIAAALADNASGAGEGAYWKYESFLKRADAELGSVVGAAGELFSVRTELFEPVPPNALLDDFMISLRIAQKGYRVAYEPGAFAVETASASVEEEMKRKIRISAGGIQSIVWLRALLNPFRYGWLSFQYISHRVLRWTLAPLALLLVLVANVFLAPGSWFYQAMLAAQVGFYGLAVLGWGLAKRKIKFKPVFIPFYFAMMNWCVFLGLARYLSGRQSVLWEKARRAPAGA
jgi:cellulose synthase/poly-beta-1,6-N-acetylglucosamine synthase-like glycosyltransferase